MKLYILSIFVVVSLIFSSTSFIAAQQVENREEILDSLLQVQDDLQEQLNKVKILISLYQPVKKTDSESQNVYESLITTKKGAYLLSSPDLISEILFTIPANQTFSALNFNGHFWKINYKEKIGYIPDEYINASRYQKEFFISRRRKKLNRIGIYLRVFRKPLIFL